MSWQATAWVDALPYDACQPLAFRVLLKFANVADERGQRAWIAKSTMADDLGVSQRSIHRAVKELLNERLITPGDQRYVMHLRADRRPTVYDINLMHSAHEMVALTLDDGVTSGVTQLSTGVTTAVADGVTTGVTRTTHRTTTTKDLENPAIERSSCPRFRATGKHFIDPVENVCFACGEVIA